MSKRDRDPQFPQSSARRDFIQRSGALTGWVALGGGSYLLNPRGAWAADPIKVGIATDLTGPIGYAGIPNSNVAKMVIDEINAAGGLLGRPLQIVLEDTASNEQVAVTRVRKLIQKDKVAVVFGGITSSMRNAIKDTIVNRGKTLYILSTTVRRPGVHQVSLLHRPDPGAAVRHLHPVADQERRQEVLPAIGRLCLAARTEQVCPQDHREERR